MRRAQIDAGSQPVRNLTTNPRAEGVGASGVIRQNLCTNPGIEAVGGAAVTVRTNFAVRPRMQDTSLGGYGTQTLTFISGIPTHPNGITTANRVAYTAGASNPGAFIYLTPGTNTRYAVSAWVYNEGASSETIGLALSGVSSGGSQVVAPGVWTRLEWVATTTGTASTGFGVRISSPSANGSFLVTGVTLELATLEVVPTFFDGDTAAAGDFTYAWTGTAGQSTSLQRGIACPSYLGANNAVTYRTGTPGTALAARTFFTSNTVGDSGVALGLTFTSVAASKTYTLSVDITTSTDRTMKLSIQGAGTVNTSATFAHTAGVKVRRSITFQTNSSATSANVALYILRNDILGGTFDIDNVLIEEALFANTYFDGSTAATADFTHTWAGTANASTSRQSAFPVAFVNATGSGAKLQYQCSDRPAASPHFTRTVVGEAVAVGINTTDIAIAAGVTRTDIFWLRTSRALSIQTRYRNLAGSGVVNGPIITTTANVWQEWRLTAAPAGYTDLGLSLLVTAGALGDIIDLGPRMTVEGTYTGDFIDGTKPFSKWLGATDSSVSVGYPPQLLDIAGTPIFDVSAAGLTTLDNSFGAQEGRTIYSVVEILQEVTGSISPIIQYGDNALNDTVPNTWLQFRIDNNGVTDGNSNLFVRRTGGAGVNRTVNVRRHVSAWGINDSGYIYQALNGGAPAVDNVVMSLLHQKINVIANDAYHNHIRTIGYRGYHDDATRLAISRYLGNKYGANVA